MDLYRGLTPAVLSYEGIAFQYMAPAVFEDRQLAYVQKHLRIQSVKVLFGNLIVTFPDCFQLFFGFAFHPV